MQHNIPAHIKHKEKAVALLLKTLELHRYILWQGERQEEILASCLDHKPTAILSAVAGVLAQLCQCSVLPVS